MSDQALAGTVPSHSSTPASRSGSGVGVERGDRRAEVPGGEVVPRGSVRVPGRRPGAGRAGVKGPQRLRPLSGETAPQRIAHEAVLADQSVLVADEERAPLEEVLDQRARVLTLGHPGGDLGREPVEDGAVLEQPPGRLAEGVDHLGEEVLPRVPARPGGKHDAGDPALRAPPRLVGLLRRRLQAEGLEELTALVLGDGEGALVEVHGLGPGRRQRPRRGPPGGERQARAPGQLAHERGELVLGGRAEEGVRVVQDEGEIAVRSGGDRLAQHLRQAGPGDARVAGAPHDGPRRIAHGQREQRALPVPGAGDDPEQPPVEPGARALHEGLARQAGPRKPGRLEGGTDLRRAAAGRPGGAGSRDRALPR